MTNPATAPGFFVPVTRYNLVCPAPYTPQNHLTPALSTDRYRLPCAFSPPLLPQTTSEMAFTKINILNIHFVS